MQYRKWTTPASSSEIATGLLTVIPPPSRRGATAFFFASVGGCTIFRGASHVLPPSALRRISTSMWPQSAPPCLRASQ
jgi:hypothetical protein